MEVISRIKCGYLENIRDLTAELIDRYSSAENAVVALKTGKASFEKVYPSLPNLTKGKAGPGRKKRGSKAGQGFSKGGVL